MNDNSLAIFNDPKNIQLLKDTLCKGADDGEFGLFIYACKRLGLDPFARQIYPVKRWNSSLNRESMTIQTGIDGYRLIADRTGRYAPGRPTEFEYKDGKLFSATAYVKKQTQDGTWHEVSNTAYFDEYCGRTKDGKPTGMWESKPTIMLSKCSEASCLRKCFPSELSGIYTKEEMDQADNNLVEIPPAPTVNIDDFVDKYSQKYNPAKVVQYIEKRSAHFGVSKEDTVFLFMKDESKFFKEFESWQKREAEVIKA